MFEESNGPQLIFCHVSSNQLHELPEQRYVIFSKILPHRIIVKAMQIVLQNKCANHFCHFFYKKNKKCGTLQKRLANLRFLLVYFARNSTRATDRRHSLQTHFVIHVCLFVKFHSVLFDLSNSGVWPDQPVQDRVRHTQLWRLICQKVENEKNRSCGRERKKHLKVQQFSTGPSISFFFTKKN